MNTADWLLLFHLLGAFALVSGAVVANGARLGAVRPRPPGEVALLADAERRGVRYLLLPGALVALVFGILLASDLDYSFSSGWISAAFLMWVALVLIAEGAIVRSARELRAFAEARGPAEADLRLAAQARGPVLTYAYGALNGLVIALIVVMVWRPGA
jgi:hypothetical protein